MSWSDVFYPGNPEKREKLIRKSQELQEVMKNNFRATNQLIDVLKKHLGLSFSPITLNEKATVKENCDVIIERIHEVQAEVEKIDKELKDKLEPTLYDKLINMSLSIPENKKVLAVFHLTLKTVATVSFPLITWLIYSRPIMTQLASSCRFIGASVIGTIGLTVIFLGIDMIVQAILGAVERDQLENALKEYEKALEGFRPASEKYQDSITYVRVRLENLPNN